MASKVSTSPTSEQALYRLLRFFQKAERTHAAAPPFRPRFALLDSRTGL